MNTGLLFPAGKIIDTKYQITRYLGAGAFGVVHEAMDLKLNRRVAIKSMIATDIDSAAARFINEVEATKALEHENVVRLYDYGRDEDDVLHIVMEYVEGQSLTELLINKERLNLVRASGIILQVLDVLIEAHGLGIVHRDLKPDNILLTAKGARNDVVKVLDFGIAALLGRQGSASNEICGTPMYMAPEQVRGDDVGPQTDIYALGLVFLELVTGEPAMAADTLQEAMRRQLEDPVPIPRRLQQMDLGATIGKAVAKDLKHRYSSARQMYDDLQAAMAAGTANPLWGTIDITEISDVSAIGPSPAAPAPASTEDFFGSLATSEAWKEAHEQGDDTPAPLSDADPFGLNSADTPAGAPVPAAAPVAPADGEPQSQPTPRVRTAAIERARAIAEGRAQASAPAIQGDVRLFGQSVKAELELDETARKPAVSSAAQSPPPAPLAPRRASPVAVQRRSGLWIVAALALVGLLAVGAWLWGPRLWGDAASSTGDSEAPPTAQAPAPVVPPEVLGRLSLAFVYGALHGVPLGVSGDLGYPVTITTIPPEATVSIDGVQRCTGAPCVVWMSSLRESECLVTHPGYTPHRQTISPSTFARRPLRVILEPAPKSKRRR